jgi:hypothetical protein
VDPNETLEAQLARGSAQDRISAQLGAARDAEARAMEARLEADEAGARQERRDADAARMQTLHYPNGNREHRAGSRALEVGDVLRRDGQEWQVLSIDGSDPKSVVAALGPRPSPRAATP